MTGPLKPHAVSGPPVAPLRLIERVGTGGMGQVWRALHVEDDLQVALKVLAEDVARRQLYRETFAAEVRAVAGLTHPHIITLYDHGVIGQALRDDRLPLGAPYLLMEYVEGGSLERWSGPWPFAHLVALLTQVLEALGHAHARGVIHRDLKPGNILVADDGERVIFKLADFGIAHAWVLDQEQPEALVAGTPPYMPPEQILGQSTALGPWTDLYALGCLAWELCCGYAPFEAATTARTLTLQLQASAPPLRARAPVPPWFEAWLGRLLHKSPAERFACAADAAYSLHQHVAKTHPQLRRPGDLGAADWARVHSRLAPLAGRPWSGALQTTLARSRVRAAHEQTAVLDALERAAYSAASPQEGQPTGPGPAPLPRVRPPCPEVWPEQAQQDAALATPLSHVGLALFGLRAVPFVGRLAERACMSQALRRVSLGQGPGLLCVQGPSGVGKTQLITWLITRASELGAARALVARHQGPQGGPQHGLGAMLARALRLSGRSPADHASQLMQALQALEPSADEAARRADAAALLALIWPDARHEGAELELPPVRFSHDSERYALLWRTLRALQRADLERPLILWCDDVQWGADALGFARWLWGRLGAPGLEQPASVLLIVSAREDLLPERPLEAQALDALIAQADARAQRLALEPLTSQEQGALLARLLRLEPSLAAQILARTEGNPLFAVQLLADWIERGWLEAWPGRGFALRAGVEPGLPDDLHALWRQRIGRLMRQRYGGYAATQARCALEIAALLGAQVDRLEWQTACALARVQPPEDLEEVLGAQGLLISEPASLRFVHGMLRESLERLAHEAQRAHLHHDASAQMLTVLYGEHALGQGQRLAHHLLAAGRHAQALAPLLAASYQAQLDGRYAQAAQHLEAHARVAQQLGLAAQDARVLKARQQGVWLSWLRHGLRDQDRHACDEIAAMAAAGGHDEVLGECYRWRAQTLRFSGQLELSLAQLDEALACFERAQDLAGAARAHQSKAVVLRALGRLELAEDALSLAISLAERSDLFVLLPRCFGNLAQVALQRGQWAVARARFERALKVCAQVGDRKAAAFAWIGLAELALYEGPAPDLEGADRALKLAVAGFEALGSRYARAARLDRVTLLALRPEGAGMQATAALALAAGGPGALDELVDADALSGAQAAAAALLLGLAPVWARLQQLDEAMAALQSSRWLLVAALERLSDLGALEPAQRQRVRAHADAARALLHRGVESPS